jgi:hypothetical protein
LIQCVFSIGSVASHFFRHHGIKQTYWAPHLEIVDGERGLPDRYTRTGEGGVEDIR